MAQPYGQVNRMCKTIMNKPTLLLIALLSLMLVGCKEDSNTTKVSNSSSIVSEKPEGYKNIKFGMTSKDVDELNNCNYHQTGYSFRAWQIKCDSTQIFLFTDMQNRVESDTGITNYILVDLGLSEYGEVSKYQKYKNLLSKKYKFELELTNSDGDLKAPPSSMLYSNLSVFENGMVMVGLQTQTGHTVLHYANSDVSKQIWNKYKNFKTDALNEL